MSYYQILHNNMGIISLFKTWKKFFCIIADCLFKSKTSVLILKIESCNVILNRLYFQNQMFNYKSSTVV